MTPRAATLLRAILEGRQPLQAHAQPVLGLRSLEPVAQEYLTRFLDPRGRLCSLADLDFVNLDDATRLEVDLLCLDSTFKVMRDQVPSDRLHFINVEPMTLESPRFWGKLQGWLGDLQIPPLSVVVEFTESHGIHDLDLLQNCAKSLRSHGLQLAVDDLGAGVASLTHMARLAPDFIKADRSLVEQAHRRPYQAALLNALSVFAQRMCIGFIAEGIETPEELQAVIDADVPWGQGFVFGQPQPLKVEPLWSDRRGAAPTA
ncbi:MAG TPA: EAL domain-containing protein [Holophagaceae bacterium]|nr:EAL domain-containing protein [Holophagaceae bacterium]